MSGDRQIPWRPHPSAGSEVMSQAAGQRERDTHEKLDEKELTATRTKKGASGGRSHLTRAGCQGSTYGSIRIESTIASSSVTSCAELPV